MKRILWAKIFARQELIFLLIGALLLLDEFRKRVAIFTFSDIFVFRPTHEKFILLAAFGFFLAVRRKSRKKKT